MRTLLISDIKGQEESIIPYALNFSKLVNNRVHIIHPVDPQKQPGVSSSVADSQSFEIAEKLSHDQIIRREMSVVKTELDKLLSHEASRLNFPLRVKTSVTENTLRVQLLPELEHRESKLIIFSSSPDGMVIDNLNEILQLTSSNEIFSLIVPPGLKFKKPEKAFILYDFNIEKNQNIFLLLSFLSQIELSINVGTVAKKSEFIEMEIKSELWKQVAQNHKRTSLRISTNILEGKNYVETLLDYFRRNKFDLVILPKKKAGDKSADLFEKNILKQMIDNLNIPVLIY